MGDEIEFDVQEPNFALDPNADNVINEHITNAFTNMTFINSFEDKGQTNNSCVSHWCREKDLTPGGIGFLDPRILKISDLDATTRSFLMSAPYPPVNIPNARFCCHVWPPRKMIPLPRTDDDNRC